MVPYAWRTTPYIIKFYEFMVYLWTLLCSIALMHRFAILFGQALVILENLWRLCGLRCVCLRRKVVWVFAIFFIGIVLLYWRLYDLLLLPVLFGIVWVMPSLVAGYIWPVGNGYFINLWKDAWRSQSILDLVNTDGFSLHLEAAIVCW